MRITRIINAGGIPQKNDVLNQVYANVLQRPVMVSSQSVVSLGSAIFAFLAASTYRTVEEAQDKLCPPYKVFEPDLSAVGVYDRIYPLYQTLYFALGTRTHSEFGDILPVLMEMAAEYQKR